LLGTVQSDAVKECTRSIVEHVEIIKRLANEFSEYGRMPTAQFVSTDLATLVANTVQSFTAEQQNVSFSCVVEGKIPEMLLDPEQIHGVVRNLLNNAVAAVLSRPDGAAPPCVEVKLSFDRKVGRSVLEVLDNGPGVPASDKSRIFEPYFTTKKGGTGLGLAIVSTIISDHQGEIRVFDNRPYGTRMVVSLPQFPQPGTLRRIGAAASEA
jgi:two-component system nitrogen regulation sensor histidine kinase NtrY